MWNSIGEKDLMDDEDLSAGHVISGAQKKMNMTERERERGRRWKQPRFFISKFVTLWFLISSLCNFLFLNLVHVI